MPQPKQRLDFLYNEDGQTYLVDNGVVTVSGTPVPLTNTPDGWEGTEIRYRRNADYFGILRSFTTPLKFVRDGAKIIRNRAWLSATGFADRIYLVINLLDKSFGGGWVHRFFYKGALDLTQIQDEKTGVTVNIAEDGLVKILKANENTKYTIPIAPAAVPVQLDGILMDYIINYRTIDVADNQPAPGSVAPLRAVPLAYIDRDGAAIGLAGETQMPEPVMQGRGNNYFLLSGGHVTNIILSGTIQVKKVIPAAIPQTIIFYLLSGDPSKGVQNELTRIPVSFSTAISNTGFTDVPITANFTMLENEVAYLAYLVANPSSAGNLGVEFAQNNITIAYKYRIPPNVIGTLRPKYVAQQLVNAMAGHSNYTVQSPILDEWQNLVLTSGDAIRNITADPAAGIAEPAIVTSFKEFFDAYNVPLNLMCEISGETIVINKKERAFVNVPSLMFNNIRDFTKSIYNAYVYTRIKIGYPDVTLEDINGKREVNVTQEYTTGLEVPENELTLVSNFFASMFEIEFTRMKTLGQNTTNNQNDNRIFFLHINPAPISGRPFFNLYRKAYTNVQGLPNWQTAFNLELSPKRCLLRHGNFIHGAMWFQPNNSIKFQNSQRNAELVTTDATETIAESADVPVNQLAAPLFAPVVFSFTSPIPKDIVNTIETEPGKTFIFANKDFLLSGFPLEVGLFPSTNAATETKLLAAPDTDKNALL